MTAEEREAATKLRTAEKERADNLKPELILEHQGADVEMAALVEAAKADFHNQKKRALVTDLISPCSMIPHLSLPSCLVICG